MHLTALLSTVMMGLNDIHADEGIKGLDRLVDYIITGLFCFEIFLKIFALGWRRANKKEEAEDGEESAAAADEEGEGQEKAKEEEEEEAAEVDPRTLLTPAEEESIKQMFQLFDTDNNMTMDEFELRVAMRGLGFGVSRQQVRPKSPVF